MSDGSIAIIGASCRFPGASSLEAYWELLASGTDAIYLSLCALGIASGDEVILPAHAPAPVIEPILGVGAVPVLCDKAKDDYGLDLPADFDRSLARGQAPEVQVLVDGSDSIQLRADGLELGR